MFRFASLPSELTRDSKLDSYAQMRMPTPGALYQGRAWASWVALGLCRAGAAEAQVTLMQPQVGTAPLLHSMQAGHEVWLTTQMA